MAEPPIDVTKLPPEIIAKHLAKPEGLVGSSVIASLNRTNVGPYTVAIHKLRLSAGDRLIEIGFGNGSEIERLRISAKDIQYHGVDISETMVSEATAQYAAAVHDGKIVLKVASSAALPYSDHSFDKALTLNTIYFWPEPATDLSEIRRVVRPGGRLVIGAIAPWSTTSRAIFRHGFAFYDEAALSALLAAAGFPNVHIETIKDVTTSVEGNKIERDYFIASAQ